MAICLGQRVVSRGALQVSHYLYVPLRSLQQWNRVLDILVRHGQVLLQGLLLRWGQLANVRFGVGHAAVCARVGLRKQAVLYIGRC